jgi:DNA-directed RNA polymerase subunit RPC12/RpoP
MSHPINTLIAENQIEYIEECACGASEWEANGTLCGDCGAMLPIGYIGVHCLACRDSGRILVSSPAHQSAGDIVDEESREVECWYCRS